MKTLIRWLMLPALCLVAPSLAQSETRVSGALHGVWTPEESPYIIEGESRVPVDCVLVIQPGVTVELACAQVVDVRGGFQAIGTEVDPIIIEAVSQAEGFRFEGAVSDTVKLSHVRFSSTRVPRYALMSNGRPLVVDACEIWAQHVAIECNGVAARIVDSKICKTAAGDEGGIHLREAANSRLERDTVEVDVPGTNDTWGIYVDDTPDLEIDSSDIRVSGYGHVAGIWCEGMCNGLTVSRSVVRAKTYSFFHWARGVHVWTSHSQNCLIVHCTMHVISGHSEQSTISLWGPTGAEVANSILWLDGRGQGYFVYENGAEAFINHCDLWQTESTMSGRIGGGGVLDGEDEEGDVGNLYADPLFVSGEPFDYHLQLGSPCIDTGDPDRPPDPDGTIPDIGALFFVCAAAPDPGPVVPEDVFIGAAFPNPFNMSTVVPLELSRPAFVDVVVFNTLGQQEDRMAYARLSAGRHLVPVHGGSWASGVHFIQLIVDGRPAGTQRVILIK
jgi:hypothetical protein